MSAIITSKFRILNANKFKDQFASPDASKNIYFFVAKSSPWAVDISPDTTVESIEASVATRFELLGLKKLTTSNISNVIPRHDWDSSGNTKYVAYSHQDTTLFEHPTSAEVSAAVSDGTYTAGSTYVVTEDFNVYKCLFNNGNAKSTDKPTGRSTSVITTSDGYKWKYMYTISASEALKFMTDDWIPVKTLLADDTSDQWDVQAAAVSGAIDIIKVTAGGTGYVNVYGDGYGDPDGFLVSATVSTFVLKSAASASDNAYTNSEIFITAGTGAGQRRTISGYVGSTRTGTVSANWTTTPDGTSKFEILPKTTITGDGTGAQAKPVVVAGAITVVNITAPGTGYHYATLTITGGGGTGATTQVVISPLGGHGKDAVAELGGFFIMTDVRLDYNESDFPLANDYRKIGLMINVKDIDGTTISTASTRNGLVTYTLSSVTGTFGTDEIVESNDAAAPRAKVVDYTVTGSGTGTLTVFQDSSTGFGTVDATDTITGLTSGATATVASIAAAEVSRFTGDIIYVENRRPIMRAQNQSEVLQCTIEF